MRPACADGLLVIYSSIYTINQINVPSYSFIHLHYKPYKAICPYYSFIHFHHKLKIMNHAIYSTTSTINLNIQSCLYIHHIPVPTK